MNELLIHLSPDNHATAVEIAALPTDIRGYGHVKARAMAKAASKLQTLLERFRTPVTSVAA
jgi:indolepyruvate ferredoxin oxidoreductase